MSKTHCYGEVLKKGLAMLLSMTLLLGSTLPGVEEGINALQDCGTDVVLTFTCRSRRFRCIVPADFEYSTLADENGSVCILCLAETVGVVQL